MFTRPAQVALAVFSVAGFVAFLRDGARAAVTITDGPVLLLVLVPGQLLATLAHEAGHAFTTKAFGREVLRAGVGWYWFGPVAFVDTSDMWLAGRWPRVAVSLAGPYANVVLAGAAALAAAIVSSDLAAAVLWQFALVSYAALLLDLNPLLEFDGYYVLMDLLERPNLRQRALAWLRWQLPTAIRTPRALTGHFVELLYAVASLAYIGVAAVLTAVLYRLLLQDWLARLLSPPAAAALGWVVATLFIALVSAGTIGDLRAARAPNRA
jgi:putative peptide zinc metalloprotease protein